MTAAILAFALGVCWLQQQAALPDFAAGQAWLWVFVAAVPCFAFRPLRRLACLAIAFVLGIAWATGWAQYRLADRLAPGLEGRDLQVIGVVSSLPAISEHSLRFEFSVEDTHADPHATADRLPAKLLLTWFRESEDDRTAGVHPGVHPGERWLLTVRLKRPHGSVNPHGFDFEAWLLERGIGATGYVRPQAQAILLGERYTLADRIERAREAIRDHFLRVLGNTTSAGVLAALAVGDQHAIGREDWRLFSRTGVTHLMSISGLHVTLISGLIAALVSAIWRRSPGLVLRLPARKAAAVAAALTALGYTLLAGFGVPAQRTFFMVGAVAAALWFGRISSASRVLALALLAVLLVDPWAVLAPGFWLSFSAVGLIFYISHGWVEPPPEGRQAAGPAPGWIARGSRMFAQWAHVQWAITVGLAPAALLLFAQVSLVGPIANAVAIPAVSAIITPLALLCVILPVDALLQFADLLTAWLLDFLAWCDTLPLALWQQPMPAPWTIGVAIVGVLWLLAPRGIPSRWLGLVLFLPALLIPAPRPAAGQAWITTLDVGQGLAVVVRTAGHTLLYDAGPAYGPDADSGERVIAPYLRATGATPLDMLVITHNDADHSGGAQSIMESVPVGRFRSSLETSNPLVAMAADPGRCARGERWRWDGIEFAFLHPAVADFAARGRKINNLSCVLQITGAKARVLLTGDIEKQAEALLLAREGNDLRADVLLAPHHGSRTSSTAAFLEAVRPRLIVVAAGYRNRFGHPKADVLARYAAAGATVLRTDLDGAVSVHLDATGYAVLAERALRPRYWHAARL
jgi:competence protein ComEC